MKISQKEHQARLTAAMVRGRIEFCVSAQDTAGDDDDYLLDEAMIGEAWESAADKRESSRLAKAQALRESRKLTVQASRRKSFIAKSRSGYGPDGWHYENDMTRKQVTQAAQACGA